MIAASMVALGAVAPALPIFPVQWSTHIHGVVTGQGGGVVDCDFAFDAVNNATAYRNCGPQGQTVTLFQGTNRAREYHIGPPYKGFPTGRCEFWCNLNGDISSSEESLMSYDYTHRAKYNRSTTLNGQAVDVFSWVELLVVMPMADQHLYVEKSKAVPVYRDHHFHPFGKDVGHIYSNYTNFVAGAPDKAMFDIPGLDKCTYGGPQQCGDSELEAAKSLERGMRRFAVQS